MHVESLQIQIRYYEKLYMKVVIYILEVLQYTESLTCTITYILVESRLTLLAETKRTPTPKKTTKKKR